MSALKQTHVREFRSLLKYAKTAMPEDAVESAEHVALLISLLQVMSSIITAMVKHKFWTPVRDEGLDVYELLQTLPTELLNRAGTDDTDEFWNSPAIEPLYWPLHLRAMLHGGTSASAASNPGEYIAMHLRTHTIAPVAHRFLDILESVFECSQAAAQNKIIMSLKLNLHAFLRRRVKRLPDQDMDPYDAVAKSFHLREFAGEVPNLSVSSMRRLHTVLKDIQRKHGDSVVAILEHATIEAGRRNQSDFGFDTSANDDELSQISKASVLQVTDCGRLLMTQMQNMELTLAILHALAVQVDDEETFFRVVEDGAYRDNITTRSGSTVNTDHDTDVDTDTDFSENEMK